MPRFTGVTSVSGIEPETCFQSFGHRTKALALFFWTFSFRWVPDHQEPEKHLEKAHWCWPGFEPGPPDYQSDTLPTVPSRFCVVVNILWHFQCTKKGGLASNFS